MLSGEIKVERIYTNENDTSTYLQKTYFQNGQLESMGNLKKGKKDGIWEGWYEDGILSWTVEYENGIVKPLPKTPRIKITTYVEPVFQEGKRVFQVGIPQYLRIYIEGAENELDMATNGKAKLDEIVLNFKENGVKEKIVSIKQKGSVSDLAL